MHSSPECATASTPCLLSPRRYGKTSLLHAAEARLARSRPAAAIIEVNVLRATSLSGLVGLLAAGAYRIPGGRWLRARQGVPEFLRRIRVSPMVTFDPSGAPRFGFDTAIAAPDAESVLADLYALLAEEAEQRPAALVLDRVSGHHPAGSVAAGRLQSAG